MLISSSQSVATQIVKFVIQGGNYPAMVIEGVDQGNCDLVVFGAPQLKGEGKMRVGAQFVENVPFGPKGGEDRKGLFPYWDLP
jgi:hypothetical protein